MASKGWFKVDRKIFDNTFLNQGPFDRFHAWLDLIGMASFEDSIVYEGNTAIQVPRGSLYVKSKDLEKRWNWSRKQVRAFLGSLEGQSMVTTKGTTKGTTITIENYAFYQGQGPTKGTTEGTTKGTTKGQQRANKGTSYYYMKNVKEGEEGKEDVAAAPSATTPHSNNYIPDDEPLPKHVEDWLARTVSTIPRRRTDR